jgi:hypothetical protein
MNGFYSLMGCEGKKRIVKRPDVVVHIYNPSYSEGKSGGLQCQVSLGKMLTRYGPNYKPMW